MSVRVGNDIVAGSTSDQLISTAIETHNRDANAHADIRTDISNLNNTKQDTLTAGTGIDITSNTVSNAGVRSVATGTTNGTISVNTNGTSAEVAVAGLQNGAYSSKGTANGVASLDGNKKIPIDQIPNLDNNYVNASLGTTITPIAAGAHNSLKKYGWFYNNGMLTGIGLLTLAQNRFYQIDKRGGTVTCNYDDVVSSLSASLVNGDYNGYFPSINPSTAFADKPFVCEVTKPTPFELSDVTRLRIYGHRLGNGIKSTHYKIEVKYGTGNTDWATAYEYEGTEKSIVGQYSLQVAGVASTSYHPIYGIRLTIYESTSTVFEISQIELVTSRGTEKLPDAMHVLADTGGTVYGDITIPDNFGSFKGNLTGTASKATADANGNNIASTYTKADTKGTANGVASLDANAKVPSEQIPVATASALGGVKVEFDETTGTLNIKTE